jgi:hypothetical protein
MKKRCDWCHQNLPLSSFARLVGGEMGRQGACRDCYAENWRQHHNIQPEPPKRRVSAYDRMGEVLGHVELALIRGDVDAAREVIAGAREAYSL